MSTFDAISVLHHYRVRLSEVIDLDAAMAAADERRGTLTAVAL